MTIPEDSHVDDSGWAERRLERTVLRTRRATVDLYDLIPNDNQPRLGPKEDVELQRQIEANQGIFEPLLVEPHPDIEGKYRIVDGDRRWTNSRILVESHKKRKFREIPVEIIDHTLTDHERYRVWVYIHRQRKEWDAREKEMVAYRLVDLVGRASAANILGVTVRALDKLVNVFQLSQKLQNVKEPGASITWAREINGISKKLLTPSALNAVIQKANERKITNSKDIRQLRRILRDPIARDEFLSEAGTIESSLEKLGPQSANRQTGLAGDVGALVDTMKRYPWTALESLRGDEEVLGRIEEAEQLLRHLKASLKR